MIFILVQHVITEQGGLNPPLVTGLIPKDLIRKGIKYTMMIGGNSFPVSNSHVRVPQPCHQRCQYVGPGWTDVVSEG